MPDATLQRRAATLAVFTLVVSLLVSAPVDAQVQQFTTQELQDMAYMFSDMMADYGPMSPPELWPMRQTISDTIDYLAALPPVSTIHPLLHPTFGPLLAYLLQARTQVVIDRLEGPPPTEGARLSKLYSSSWIIETPQAKIAVDYSDIVFTYSSWPSVTPAQVAALANNLDAYFITHIHTDHVSDGLAAAMAAAGKPIYVPQDILDLAIGLNHPLTFAMTVPTQDVVAIIGDITWTSFAGHQWEQFADPAGLVPTPTGYHVENQCYLFDANGVGIAHFGDNNDVFILPWALNKVAAEGWSVDVALNLGRWHPELMTMFTPQVRMHTHELELTHFLNFVDLSMGPAPDPFRRILLWGESMSF